LEAVALTLKRVGSGVADARELFELARADNDGASLEQIGKDVEGSSATSRRSNSAGCSPTRSIRTTASSRSRPGAGGTEAQDWASMLERMYLKYCDKKKFSAEVLEQTEGEGRRHQERDDQDLRRLRVRAPAHRERRAPARAQVAVRLERAPAHVVRCRVRLSEVDESIEVAINPADLRVDVYRASGAGGQHVNKTESAVRITHLPTGIVVQSQNDRSQHRNRAECMAMLKSRLYELELRKRTAEHSKLEASKTDVEWGHQIRSYVLDQSRIKDLRTGVEKGATQTVLDGDLDDFINESLKQGV
jgi:peptide chain release factor 2